MRRTSGRIDKFTDDFILLQDYIIIQDRLLEHPRKLEQFLSLMEYILGLWHPGAYFSFPDPPATLVEETKKVWGKRLKRMISDSEAIEIIRSFSDFFVLLKEIKANAK